MESSKKLQDLKRLADLQLKSTPESRDISDSREINQSEIQWDNDGPNRIIYESRYVAFIDILGFRSIVQKSTNYFLGEYNHITPEAKEKDLDRKILEALSIPRGAWKESFKKEFGLLGNEIGELDLRISTFSDSVIVTSKENEFSFSYLIYCVSFLVRSLMQQGFLVRGGITQGEIHHVENTRSEDDFIVERVFGPAFIKAYDLESKHANTARIILCNRMWQEVLNWRQKSEECKYCSYINSMVVRDNDGPARIDTLRFYKDAISESGLKSVENELIQIKNKMEGVLNYYTESPRVFSKLSKFAKEFNLMLNNAKLNDNDIERVSVHKDHLPS